MLPRMSQPVELEPEAAAFAAATANPPYLFDLGPEKGRAVVDEVQSSPIDKPLVDIREARVPAGEWGEVPVRIIRPAGARGPLPAILYIHGAGWVFGNAHTHDRLVRMLATRTGAAVVFPEYSLSPEARYPTALEQSYAVARWLAAGDGGPDLDVSRLAIAGDSVGGNMSAALTLLARQRGGPRFAVQVLFYPVTDAAFDTESYHRFATGHFLRRDAMQWFWDQYLPDHTRRAEITASPLRATLEQLSGLPPALVITAEADVLRDEGEAYAAKLRAAGVPVTAARFLGTIHDFVMLNALAHTRAAEGALMLAVEKLRAALAT
jgi:acetyl esterase